MFEITWLACISIVFCAGLVQGLTGFGFSMVAVSALSLLLGPKIVIPMVLLYSLFMNFYMFYGCYPQMQLRRVLHLTLGAVLGIPVGTAILVLLNPDLLKIFMGASIIAFTLLLLFGFQKKTQGGPKTMWPVGFFSGLLNGSITLGGPAVILFYTNQGLSKETFRANMTAYFTVLNLLTLPLFLYNGLLTQAALQNGMLFFPGLVLGIFTGGRLVKKVSQENFRRFTFVLLLLSGSTALVSGLVRVLNDLI